MLAISIVGYTIFSAIYFEVVIYGGAGVERTTIQTIYLLAGVAIVLLIIYSCAVVKAHAKKEK